MDTNEAALLERAKAGDREAIGALLGAVERRIYNVALRMVGDPAEAEDCTQEILVKAARGLSSFRGDSSFSTWVHRIAANYLINQRERGVERLHASFDHVGAMIDEGLVGTENVPLSPQDSLLAEEAKLTCTQGMLVCLDRDQRLAYILGELVELNSEEAAEVLEIDPTVFRKRLSRARERIESFMQGRCGLVNQKAPCRCHKQVPAMTRNGLIQPGHPRLANPTAHSTKASLDEMLTSAAVFRSQPEYRTSESFLGKLRELVDQAVPN